MHHKTLRAANLARQPEWDQNQVLTGSIGKMFAAIELAGEAGEVANVVKKLEREELGLPGSRAKIIDLAHELADVVICADLLAIKYDINLDQAISAKFNATSAKLGFQTRLAVDLTDYTKAIPD